MRCSACGDETPDGKRFCANCGRPLAAACGSCGAELLPGKAFCADCGSPVSDRPTPQTAAAPVVELAERRVCSVLFVDLVGFTPLAEQRDPEYVRELLSRYYERARTIIGNYGGVVEKFIGDAVMAVFGAPVANEDDAERAVRAGLDVVASVAELGKESGLSALAARGGVVTGEVAITIGRTSEGMALGDTVNSASRLQGTAEPGTVLVDESTWSAASRAIAFSAVGALTLKGKDEPVPAFRALRVVAQRQGVGRSEGLEPPFVGRDAELRFVKEQLQSTIAEHRARLVSVVGVPGIGKSRLAWEFLKYVDGLADTVYWHQGRSPAYGEGVTFWALGEMVRMRAGINETDDAKTTAAKLAASVREFAVDEEERRWIEPRLGHLLNLADAPGGDREELFSAWRTFFERISEAGPTVMVFEDLQWADAGLVDFVESILEWLGRQPILVVTLARPELIDRRPTWGAGQRSFTSLHLEPLEPIAMRELLDGFVHGLPADVVDEVLEKADGVPLYAVEIVRALVDRGVLAERDGAYAIVGDLSGFEIPGTLHALIGSRLDALPPEERAVLQDASVLGTMFSADALAVVRGEDRSALDATLRDLVRKEFLSLDTDPRSPDRGQFGFVQALIREVASARLSRRDRAAKHLAVARHYESIDDDELAGAVAGHYLDAFRAAPDGPEAGAIRSNAREWLLRAGRRAISLGSPEQALTLFEQTLEVTDGGVDRAEVLEVTGQAAMMAGDSERALGASEESAALYEAGGDRSRAGRATIQALGSLQQLGQRSEVVRRGEAAFDAEGDDGDLTLRAELAALIADALAGSGQATPALEWAEKALAFAERLDDPVLFARVIGSRAVSLYMVGRHREAAMLAQGMAALADEAGAVREQVEARTGLSVFLLDDDPLGVVSASLEAGELARRGGMRHAEVTNRLNAAETAAYIGRLHEARTAVRLVKEQTLPNDTLAWADSVAAVVAALEGDQDAAEALLAQWEQPAVGAEYVDLRATFLGARAMVRFLAGDLRAALADGAEAIAAAPQGINAPKCLAVQARAFLWLGDAQGVRSTLAATEAFRGRWMAAYRATFEAGLAALDGDTETAASRYQHAFDLWRPLRDNLGLALAELDLVKLLGPDHPDATVAKEARDIFDEAGARALVELTDELRPPTKN